MFNIDDVASHAKAFAETPFGMWYMAHLEDMAREELRTAMGREEHELKINAANRADGITRALQAITNPISQIDALKKFK